MLGWKTTALVVVAALAIATPAAAQRRGGKAKAKPLEVELPVAVKFGEVVVPAGRYRVSVSKRGLGLTHPKTMVAVATVPVTSSQSSTTVTPATIEVATKGTDGVQLIVKSRTRIYVASGVKTDPPPGKKREVQLASRDAEVTTLTVEQKSEMDLIRGALSRRYINDVKHCADKAQRSRWKTDDKRFWNCVCPLAERWRLTKVKKDLRVHFPLAKGKSGLSITVTPKGRVKDCRVWVGPESPEQKQAKVDAEAKAVSPAAGAETDAAAEPAPAPAAPSPESSGEAP